MPASRGVSAASVTVLIYTNDPQSYPNA